MKEARDLINFLKEQNLTIAFAESVTCGLASHAMNTWKGTSETFLGSIVSYNKDVKTHLLGIKEELICTHTAESTEVTMAMADALQTLIRADVYAAITGLAVAGGSETPAKPVGTIFISIQYNGHNLSDRTVFDGSPLEIKKSACRFLFKSAIRFLQKNLTKIADEQLDDRR